MAQDPSIEAARARIQRLVDEIAALSRKDLRSEEYFKEFLARAVGATDAKGGGLWLAGQRSADGKCEFQLSAQVEFESSAFHSDERQHGLLLRALGEVINTKQPLVCPPEPPPPQPGSIEAQIVQMGGAPSQIASPWTNRTAFPFFHVPLFLKEQPLGVLQVWLQPYVKPQAYQEFVAFLSSLAGHVEQHLQSRRLGNLVMENQRLQHVLRFAGDIVGALDPLEVARLAANYGRDLIGCERCSILTVDGGRWDVLAISGQEVVEKKSSMVKAMGAFVAAHSHPDAFTRTEHDARTGAEIIRQQALTLSKKELLERSEAAANSNGNGAHSTHATDNTLAIRRTDATDLEYFEHSHVISASIAPLLNEEKELVGAYFAESTVESFFDGGGAGKESSSVNRMTEWLALHTAKALGAARDYQSLPFLPATRRLRNARLALAGPRRRRNWLRLGIISGLLFLVSLYPKVDQADGNCVLAPEHRATVAAEVPGRIEKVLVHEGDRVTKGQPLAQLDTRRLETELESVRGERMRTQAESERFRGAGDEAAAQIATIQAGATQPQEKKLLLDIASATLRSPIDGVVLTKDIEQHAGEFVQAGTSFAEVAGMSDWDLQLEVSERSIGRVEKALARHAPLAVNYILYSQSAHKLSGALQHAQQISAAAYPREKEQVFIVTLPGVQFPEEMKGELRPGLTGRAKIEMGRQPLLFWFFRRVVDWVQLKIVG